MELVIVAMTVLNNVYIATIQIYAGSVYFIVAGMLILCMLAMLLVYILHRREYTDSKTEEFVNECLIFVTKIVYFSIMVFC